MKKKGVLIKLILVIVLIVGVVQSGIYLLPRLRLDKKGYTKDEIETIMDLPDEMQDELMKTDYVNNVTVWLSVSSQIDRYLDYIAYASFHDQLTSQEVVETLDMVLDHPEVFVFSENQNRDHFYEKAAPEMIADYLQSAQQRSLADNPESLTLLVGGDNQLSMSYEPGILEACAIANAEPDEPVSYLAKEANEALKQMAEDAAKEGYILLNNSSYRSYFDQADIYDYYADLYGEGYCEHYVATPGNSEHQTGLAIDLSSRSVQEGTYFVFGDSPDYRWVNEHCYQYGFIRRYPEDKAEITGSYNEPWHYRYVGLAAAKIIHDNDWALEEYVAAYGE